jgi:hypothetical protein
MQLLLQLEQEKGEKQQLDWLVSEGKKQVPVVLVRAITDIFAGVLTPLRRLRQELRACWSCRKTATLRLGRCSSCSCLSLVTRHTPCVAQVELLRAKLEQANNKNDILRENYEMLDTKLTQVIIVIMTIITIDIIVVVVGIPTSFVVPFLLLPTPPKCAGRRKGSSRRSSHRAAAKRGTADERGFGTHQGIDTI